MSALVALLFMVSGAGPQGDAAPLTAGVPTDRVLSPMSSVPTNPVLSPVSSEPTNRVLSPVSSEERSDVSLSSAPPLSEPPLLDADVPLPNRETDTFFARVALGGELAPVGSTRPEDGAREVWAGRCAHCHGVDGQPRGLARKQGARDLAQVEWQSQRTDEQVAQVIRDGVHDSRMKSFRVALTREQITALVAYIRNFQNPAMKLTIADARN